MARVTRPLADQFNSLLLLLEQIFYNTPTVKLELGYNCSRAIHT